MGDRNNIFCASNPAKLVDALWQVMTNVGAEHVPPLQTSGMERNFDFSDDIIFLPSRRAVRTVEKMIVEKSVDAAVLLPRLVALSEAADDDGYEDDIESDTDTGAVSNTERVIILAKMLAVQMNSSMADALPVAKDLVRMMDYLENEGTGRAGINWTELVGEQYAAHFRDKAKFLDLACAALPLVFPGRETSAQKRNRGIRGWIEGIRNKAPAFAGVTGIRKVIVCGSTGSVPATADLMAFVAGLDNGYIILPGKVSGERGAGGSYCDPYYSEMTFLERIGASPADVQTVEVGESAIDFFNTAFANTVHHSPLTIHHSRFTRIDCMREAEEMEVVAEIATDAAGHGKSVLVVSPDAAAAQRLGESLRRRDAEFDFSGGKSGSQTPLGRFLLNSFYVKNKTFNLYSEYEKSGDLFLAVKNFIEKSDALNPLSFDPTDEQSAAVWDALRNISDIVKNNGIDLTSADLQGMLGEALNSVSVRPPMVPAAITILGTIESRMQTADVVILTGLNEGMFPALGYENPWLPRRIADAIGLPPPERKVSLMAMDFMTLACGPEIYWTRSKTSGGQETTESRFLSRVAVAMRDKIMDSSEHWINRVRTRDIVPSAPLDNSAPIPPADWSDVYVTELELLVHNPYAFYCRHILRLKHNPDPWEDTYAIDFGNIVHDAIEQLAVSKGPLAVNDIVEYLDRKAREVLEPGSVMFHFWHKRFVEMAPVVQEFIAEVNSTDVVWSVAEKDAVAEMEIGGRTVRARADRVYITTDNTGVAVDIKTGLLPTNAQLNAGMMPQLPIETIMLQSMKFKGQTILPTRVVMKFLSLARNKCGAVVYDGEDLSAKMAAAVAKTKEQFDIYSAGGAPYEYRETSNKKYKAYDDLARVDD